MNNAKVTVDRTVSPTRVTIEIDGEEFYSGQHFHANDFVDKLLAAHEKARQRSQVVGEIEVVEITKNENLQA